MMINTVFKDIGGIFRSPGLTLSEMMKAKRWVPIFLVILAALALVTNITLSMDLSDLAKQPGFAEYLPAGLDQTADSRVDSGFFSRVYITLFAMLMTALSFTVGAFFIYLFFAAGGAEGYYVHYFTLVTGASIIDTLLPMVRDTFSFLTGTNLTIHSNLLLLFPSLSPHTFNFWLVSQVDLFKIWYIIVIAVGVAAFAAKSLKKCLVISTLYFLFNAVVSAGFAFLAIKITTSMMHRL